MPRVAILDIEFLFDVIDLVVSMKCNDLLSIELFSTAVKPHGFWSTFVCVITDQTCTIKLLS